MHGLISAPQALIKGAGVTEGGDTLSYAGDDNTNNTGGF